jgi:nicotinamide-nucleotide amidase
MNTNQFENIIPRLAQTLVDRDMTICTAESCTGGLIAKLFTDLAGSSRWFERGFVTYSNEAKSEMLGVDRTLIDREGAVSEPVAVEMAKGALHNSTADYSIAVTGVAGPGGGSDAKPVGTVWIAVASNQQVIARRYQFEGDRHAIRESAARVAIDLVVALIESS